MEETDRPPPSRRTEGGFKRFLRGLLRWFLALLIFAALGAAAFGYFLYLPATEELDEARTALEEARLQVAELEAEKDVLARRLSEAETRASVLEADKRRIQARLDTASVHVAVLSVLTDVTGARLALASKDHNAARTHLSHAPDALNHLGALLGAEQKDVLASMKERLGHALDELEDDQYAAQSDLDVLASKLVQLSRKYFRRPRP